jgi:transcription elongation factor Elf1
MSLGLPDDPRQFPKTRKSDRVITKDVDTRLPKKFVCYACGLEIVGKAYRVSSGKYECFRCHNE